MTNEEIKCANYELQLAILKDYQNKLLFMLNTNLKYREAREKGIQADEKTMKELGIENSWYLPYGKCSDFTKDLKKYPKAKIDRLRILIKELMFELERE